MSLGNKDFAMHWLKCREGEKSSIWREGISSNQGMPFYPAGPFPELSWDRKAGVCKLHMYSIIFNKETLEAVYISIHKES